MLICVHPQCWFIKTYCDLYNVFLVRKCLTSEWQRSGQAVQGVRVFVQRVQFQLGLRQSGSKTTRHQRVTNAACSRLCNAHGVRVIIGDNAKIKCELSICAEDARCLLLPQEGVLSPDVRQLSLCCSGSQLRTTSATFFYYLQPTNVFKITTVTIITNTNNPATLVSTHPVIVSFLLMRRCLRLVRLLGLLQLVLHLCGSLPEVEKRW